MRENRFRFAPGRMVAIVGAIALGATLVPMAIAAGMSSSEGDDAKVVDTVRTVTLGGDDPAFAATFDVRDDAPDCDRQISLTIGARQFACGDVTIETRSAENVDDLQRYGIRAIRAKLIADAPMPDMRAVETPRAPGMGAWSGSAVTGVDGVVHKVIVLGDGSGSDVDEGAGTKALVAIISAEPGSGDDGDAVDATAADDSASPHDPESAVELAAATILSDVREGGAR